MIEFFEQYWTDIMISLLLIGQILDGFSFRRLERKVDKLEGND